MKTVLLAVAASLLAVTAAAAQTPPQSPDLNHDGVVTAQEFKTGNWMGWLARTDGNHDGRIAKSEVAHAAGPRGAMIDMVWGGWDTDHDNFLSRGEIDAMAMRRFQQLDTNHDGALDAAEMAAARRNRR